MDAERLDISTNLLYDAMRDLEGKQVACFARGSFFLR